MLRCRAQTQAGEKCTAARRSLYLDTAERFVVEQLAADLDRAVPWRSALARAKEDQRTQAPNVVSERHRLEAAKARLEARRSRLLDAYADGIISKSELAERVAPIDAELSGVVASLSDVPTAPDPDAYRDAGAVIAAMRAAIPRMDAEALAGVMATLRATFHLDEGGWCCGTARHSTGCLANVRDALPWCPGAYRTPAYGPGGFSGAVCRAGSLPK